MEAVPFVLRPRRSIQTINNFVAGHPGFGCLRGLLRASLSRASESGDSRLLSLDYRLDLLTLLPLTKLSQRKETLLSSCCPGTQNSHSNQQYDT
jgi:hypothetical protein